jgi:hypothetical protein
MPPPPSPSNGMPTCMGQCHNHTQYKNSKSKSFFFVSRVFVNKPPHWWLEIALESSLRGDLRVVHFLCHPDFWTIRGFLWQIHVDKQRSCAKSPRSEDWVHFSTTGCKKSTGCVNVQRPRNGLAMTSQCQKRWLGKSGYSP